jgi:hypothetical protein
MISYDFGMHRAGVFLPFFMFPLPCHAGAQRRRVIVFRPRVIESVA